MTAAFLMPVECPKWVQRCWTRVASSRVGHIRSTMGPSPGFSCPRPGTDRLPDALPLGGGGPVTEWGGTMPVPTGREELWVRATGGSGLCFIEASKASHIVAFGYGPGRTGLGVDVLESGDDVAEGRRPPAGGGGEPGGHRCRKCFGIRVKNQHIST